MTRDAWLLFAARAVRMSGYGAIGVILVLSGHSLPTLLINALTLLGQSASGVALFAAGIILAVHNVSVSGRAVALVFLKNIAEPGLSACR